MSASSIRSQLARKRDQRVDAERRVAAFRRVEASKRAAAAKAAAAARTTKSASTAASKRREADRLEREANTAGANVAVWSTKVAGYSKEEAALQSRLSAAEQSESKAADLRRKRDEAAADRLRRAERAAIERRLVAAERGVAELRVPKPERLRVLVLAASADGELRVGREVKRIQAGIRAATHRDLIELDVRMAATPADLLDGLTQFRPHVIHFSGHAAENVVVLEEDVDLSPDEVVVREADFVRALGAVDEPPELVVLNACDTARQAERLAADVVGIAIGMSESIPDGDAITFAARFYAALVDGQSVAAAFELARTELAFNGADDPDLPMIFEREPDLASALVLVLTPSQ